MIFQKVVYAIIVMVFLFAAGLVAQPYDYPIKPGMPEWKAMTSTEQRVQACQIPDSILSKMSTSDLLETCLRFPFNLNLVAFNQIQDGFNAIKKESNGWRELLQRKDLGSVVINKYSTMNPDSMISEQYPGHDFLVMETLLKQNEVINTLPKDDRIKLLKESYKKYTGKIQYPEKYAFFGVINNIALMGKILTIENYEPFVQSIMNKKGLKNKIELGSQCTKDESNEILKHVEKFIKEN